MSAREVELSGGAPWGFRLHGGADQNQPLRISRVNPGRKASLSGIREGDVISTINGRATRGLSNADAHAMLRAAGPVLRLGLNEDREMSPRRRSIGKGGELKRPSQLLAETQEATPQEPVYATIKPPLSQNWPPSSPLRLSMNSLPTSLDSTPLVRSAAPVEQPPKFHPTNPFYTTLPSNYSSASKLPVPNGKSSISSLDRSKSMNKSRDASSSYNYSPDLKSPSFFSTDYGSNSHLNSSIFFSERSNGYEPSKSYSNANDKNGISYDKVKQENQSLPNDNFTEIKNPFRSNRINSDPFEKYLNPEHRQNGEFAGEIKNMTNSMSENNFHKTKEITERSSITEHKISEIEEVKTIKKIILNGSSDRSDQDHTPNASSNMNGDRKNSGLPPPQSSQHYQSPQNTTKNDYFGTSPTQHRNDNFSANNHKGEQNLSSPSVKYHFVQLSNEGSTKAEAPNELVTAKPPATPTAPAPPSPSERESTVSPSLNYVFDPQTLYSSFLF